MARSYTHNIPSLLQGVSQQDFRTRFNTQSSEMVNVVTDVTHGTYLRSLEQTVCDFNYSASSNIFMKEYKGNTYFLYVSDLFTGVVDKYGVQYPLSELDGTEVQYIIDSLKDTTTASIQDTLVILNKKKIVQELVETVDLGVRYYNSGFFWVRGSNYNTTFTITVTIKNVSDGTVTTHSGTTFVGKTDDVAVKTDNVIANLVSSLSSSIPAGVSLDITDTTCSITSETYEIVDVEGWDSQANTYIIAGVSVNNVAELPPKAIDGVTVRISSLEDSNVDDMYYRYNSSANVWEETYMYDNLHKDANGDMFGDLTIADKSTMPVIFSLTETDGLVTGGMLEHIDMSKPTAGDSASNKLPSFVGKTLESVITYKSRFVLATNNSVHMSEVSEALNFYRTTVTDLLDGDPIHIDIDTDKGVEIDSMLALNDSIFVKGNKSQHYIRGGEILSSETVYNDVISYITANNAPAVVTGDRLFYFSESNGSTLVHSHYISDSGKDSPEVTNKHCITYLEGDVDTVASHSLTDTVFMCESGSPIVYVNVNSYKANEKVQNSFSKWLFPFNVEELFTDKDYLYVTTYDVNTGKYIVYSVRMMYETVSDKATNGLIEFSRPTIRGQDDVASNKDFRLQRGTIRYRDTTGFDVVIEKQGRGTTRYEVRHDEPTDCEVDFYVQSDAKYTTIKVESVTGRSFTILSASLEGYAHD